MTYKGPELVIPSMIESDPSILGGLDLKRAVNDLRYGKAVITAHGLTATLVKSPTPWIYGWTYRLQFLEYPRYSQLAKAVFRASGRESPDFLKVVPDASYTDGYITFIPSDTYLEGKDYNVVVAAQDIFYWLQGNDYCPAYKRAALAEG